MRLEYEFGSKPGSVQRLVNDFRTIEGELDKMARKGAARERSEARERLKITDQAFKAEQKAIARKELEEKRAQQRSIKEAERAAKEKQRIEERSLRYRQQIQNRYWQEQARQREKAAREAERAAAREARAAERAAAREARLKEQATSRAARDRTRATMGFLGGGLSTAAGLGKAALGVTGIAGGFAVSNMLTSYSDQWKAASILANQAGSPEQKFKILEEAQNVRGFTGEESIEALAKFSEKTGDLEAARGLLQEIGRLTLETGGNFGEMAEAAGQAFNVIRDSIDDPKKQLEAVKEVMETFALQGGMGAVEVRDMATELAGLGAATRKYDVDPVKMLKMVGAMAQATVARGGAPSAAEATTAITRFGADLTKSPAQKALKKLGVDVFAEGSNNQKLKDPREIMSDILEKTGGDLRKLEEILNAQSILALQGFAPLYFEAEKEKKGSGRDALYKEFSRFMDVSADPAEREAKYKSRLEDPDVQWKETQKQFTQAIGRELLPEITKLAPELAKLVPEVVGMTRAIVDFTKWASEHPAAGIGLIIGAAIAKDIAAAGVSSIVSSAIEKLMLSMAKRFGGGAPNVDVDIPGGNKGGKAGKAGRLGRALQHAPMAGAALLGAAGAGMLAYSMYEQNQSLGERAEENAEYEKLGLGRYTVADPRGGQGAGVDPNLQGSPAAIQAALGVSGAQETPKLDQLPPAKIDKADMQALASVIGSEVRSAMQSSQRFDPIISR